MRRLILATLVAWMLPTAALADAPPATSEPGGGRGGSHARCVGTTSTAGLASLADETTDPDGNAIRQLCPPGQLLVVRSRTPRQHHERPTAKESADPAHGYYHVSAAWEATKIYEAWFSVAFSSPVVPTNAAPAAHTVMQDWVVNEKCNGYTPKTLCTIELGWEKELADQEEGYKGSQPFCYYTASNYASDGKGGYIQTGPCEIVLNVAESEDPFTHHYHPTDGSAESECGPNGETKPCLGKYEWRVKQYKGAWWIQSNVPTGNPQWVGRVSDGDWGHIVNGKLTHPFTVAEEVSDGGEVYDWRSTEGGPVTPMGNGNKGACTCATPIASLTYQRKRTSAEGGGTELGTTFFPTSNLAEMSQWPQRYTAGAPAPSGSELRIGG